MTDLVSQVLNGEAPPGTFVVYNPNDQLKDGPVYLPSNYYQQTTAGSTPQYNAYNTPALSMDNAESRYWDLPKEGRMRWNQLTSMANGRKTVSSDEQGYAAWKATVQQLSQYNQQFGTTMDVFEFMQNKITGSKRLLGEDRGGSGRPPVTYSERTNLSNPATARGLLEQAMATQLGRQPTKKEQEKFYEALRAGQRAEPDKVTTRSNKSGSRQSTVAEEGFNDQQFAKEYVRSDEDFMDTQVKNQAGFALMELFGVSP